MFKNQCKYSLYCSGNVLLLTFFYNIAPVKFDVNQTYFSQTNLTAVAKHKREYLFTECAIYEFSYQYIIIPKVRAVSKIFYIIFGSIS